MTTTMVDRSTTNAPDPRFRLGVTVPTTGVILTCLALAIAWTGNLPTNVAQPWDCNERGKYHRPTVANGPATG